MAKRIKAGTWSAIRGGCIAAVVELNDAGEATLMRPQQCGPDGWELTAEWGYYPDCSPKDAIAILRRAAPGSRIVRGIPRPLPLEKY